jgi:hypothetical protein
VPARDLCGDIVGDRDDKPVSKHTLSKEARARQSLRVAELTREGFTELRGQTGLTVFKLGVALMKHKKCTGAEQKGSKCGIYIYGRLYDAAWTRTLKKHPRPRNPELPQDPFLWHWFYREFTESLPYLTQEQETELIQQWQREKRKRDKNYAPRNLLVLSLARNVGKIAGQMVTRRFPMPNGDGWHEAVHEMIACGNLGLIDAPSKITLSRGHRLSTVTNQWVRKYIHDGLASLTSAVDYPERKRKLAKFDEGIVTTAPGEDREFEAFDSFGNPTNPELKLGYLQRQVGKRLYPWHDWGADWQLLGKASRFEVKGGVSDQVQDRRQPDERPWLLVGSDDVTTFLNDWLWHVFEGHDRYFKRRDPIVIETIPWREFRQGSYNSQQFYEKQEPVEPEAARLIRYITDWRYVPGRRELDAYRHWDDNGNRLNHPMWVSERIGHFDPLDWLAVTADGIEPPYGFTKFGEPIRSTRIRWLGDNHKHPTGWNTQRHWRTSHPIGLGHEQRRDDGQTFTPRHHDYFMLLYGKFGVKAKEFGQKFDPKKGKNSFRKPHYMAKGKHHHETDRTPEIISEPLRRKAA